MTKGIWNIRLHITWTILVDVFKWFAKNSDYASPSLALLTLFGSTASQNTH